MVCHTFLLVLSVLEGCCRVAENYFSILKIFLFPISPHQRFKLSYLSKREASTTQKVQDVLSYSSVVIPLQTKGFYNREQRYQPWYWCWVVIPLQTKGFYNTYSIQKKVAKSSCHTSPNERLLQLRRCRMCCLTVRLSYLSKRKASTTCICLVLVPEQVELSYLSKRKASTTTWRRLVSM